MKNSPLQEIMKEMDNDPWYIKLKGWFWLQVWVWVCLTRKFWDKSYERYLFKKKI